MVHIRIMIATDFHLGYRQYGIMEREEDFYQNFNGLVEEAIKEKPDLFIELGDIFDEPYPKPQAIKVFRDGIKRISDVGIPVIGIIGNHTLIQRRKFYPVDKLFDENLILLDGGFLTFGNVWIGGIRYSSNPDNAKKVIDELYKTAKNYSTKILLLHQGLKEIVPIGWDMDLNEMELNRFDFVLCGHIHQRYTFKMKDTIYHYPGSLNSCSATDFVDEMKNGKGYTIVDTETKELNIKNLECRRPFMDLDLNDDDLNEHKVDEVLKSLKGYKNKPILYVKCKTKEPLDIYKACEKWEKYALFINKKIERDLEEIGIKNQNNDLSVDILIKDIMDEEYGKDSWEGEFAIELKNKLIQDEESAMEYANDIYERRIKNGEGMC